MKETIVIFGATSRIAYETARLLVAPSTHFILFARNKENLESVGKDLTARGAEKVDLHVADLANKEEHATLLEKIDSMDLVLIAHAILGNQKESERDFSAAEKVLETNFVTTVSLLTLLSNRMIEQGRGTIAVISSVAADRGRRSNYVYGSSKAGLSSFLQGLRSRLMPHGVHVLTIHPGPVDTPMTAHVKKGLLMASAPGVAHGIVKAIRRKRNIVYLPFYWRWIMGIIRAIPEFLFKRLPL